MLDLHGVSWRYYAAAKTDYGYLWSIYDAFNRIRNGPEWTTNVINPPAQFLTDVQNGTLASMTWISPTHRDLGPSGFAQQPRPELDRLDRQHRRREPVLEQHGDLHHLGRLGRLVRSRPAAGDEPDGAGHPGTADRRLAVRAPRLRLARHAYDGQHPALRGGGVDLPSLGEEDAREDDLTDAFDFTQTPQGLKQPFHLRYKLDAIRRAASASTAARPALAPTTTDVADRLDRPKVRAADNERSLTAESPANDRTRPTAPSSGFPGGNLCRLVRFRSASLTRSPAGLFLVSFLPRALRRPRRARRVRLAR